MNDMTWIVVADEGRARVFQAPGLTLDLEEVDDFVNVAHSATTLTEKQAAAFSESERKEKERDKFACQVAEYLEQGRLHQRFGRLRLVAESKFLGMMLSYLSAETRELVFEKLSKDYSALSTKEIREHLQQR
ncbi:host attachment protein [Caballeronia ptereochthonis]|uniref:Protein required for attachment to host cells n=1 Tax=Caballeronia ptereochthonis TaxID=1777144 RepID=A0A158DNJ3_9BURK|nr:host attachment protein [Caballeronia ptereochthonis]SAK96063.1 Protein required for attachment to host cells [Caballeronia ptereochthonis]